MIEFNFDKNDGEGDSNEDKLPSLDKGESKCSSQSRTEGKNTFFHRNGNTKYLPTTQKDHNKLYKVQPIVNSLVEKC